MCLAQRSWERGGSDSLVKKEEFCQILGIGRRKKLCIQMSKFLAIKLLIKGAFTYRVSPPITYMYSVIERKRDEPGTT